MSIHKNHKNKRFEMCKLHKKIQDAILESHVSAAKFVKYKQEPNLKNLALEIEKLENSQEILEANFTLKNWQEVLQYYFDVEMKAIESKNPYSLLDTV